jgi:hypothetical protein
MGDGHESRRVGPEERRPDRPVRPDFLDGGDVEGELPEIGFRNIRGGVGSRAQRLVVDDQHLVSGDDEPVDLAGERMVADEADDRHLGETLRREERCELGMGEDGECLARDRRLLIGSEAVHASREKPAAGVLALLRRKFGQGLQQSVHEETALHPCRGARRRRGRERRARRRLAPERL